MNWSERQTKKSLARHERKLARRTKRQREKDRKHEIRAIVGYHVAGQAGLDKSWYAEYLELSSDIS